jgi:hypothetical protein
MGGYGKNKGMGGAGGVIVFGDGVEIATSILDGMSG